MKKLRLDLDELSVESFDTHAAERRPGTVLARESESDISLRTDCLGSCGGTAQCSVRGGTGCDYSCDFACSDACTQVESCTWCGC